uniref:Secreted protein n=1 Tax=Setaria viridis TaxID=4556 RepID=A0A4U6TPB5_SETVI|nr:hypothetical protein SEVIR_7G035558v2 [Setaria viridis]
MRLLSVFMLQLFRLQVLLVWSRDLLQNISSRWWCSLCGVETPLKTSVQIAFGPHEPPTFVAFVSYQVCCFICEGGNQSSSHVI